jgi:hypothetical protein
LPTQPAKSGGIIPAELRVESDLHHNNHGIAFITPIQTKKINRNTTPRKTY